MRLFVSMCLLALFSLPGVGLAGGEEEAARQVGLCGDDVAAGQYERALVACDSALRFDPSREVQQEAFKLKGLALEQLGDLDNARGMFLAFKSLRSGLPDDPEVEAAIARIDASQGSSRKAPARRADKPKAARKPSKGVSAGLGLTLAAAAGSGAGWAIHAGTYASTAPHLVLDDGVYAGDSSAYQLAYDANIGGLQLGIGLGALSAVGVVLTIVVAAKEGAQAEAVLPWAIASRHGGMFGVAGVLP